MADRRINDPLIISTTFSEASSNNGRLLTDWTGLSEAKGLPVKLLGNCLVQGSTDGISYSNTVTSLSTYLRFSTDGGSNWRVLPLSDLSDIQDLLHNPLTLNVQNGLSLDLENQVLSLELATNATPGALSASDKIKIDYLIGNGTGTLFLNDAGEYVEIITDAEANTASNIGTGVGVFANKVGVDLQYKTLKSSDGSIIFTSSATEIDITATGIGGGESNTASNEGIAGVGVFHTKNGINFEFRTINPNSSRLSVVLDSLNKEIDIDVVETNINHDNLLNFSANEHIDHTSVSVIAGIGLTGGGTINSNITLDVSINELTLNPTPEGTDLLVVYDPDSGNHYKVSAAALPVATIWGGITGTINNQTDLISLFDSKTPATRNINTTGGITGGGNLTADRTLSLSFNSLSSTTLAVGDYIAFYDISNMIHARTTVQSIINLTDSTLNLLHPGDNISELVNDSGYITSVAMNDLTDVDAPVPADGKILVYRTLSNTYVLEDKPVDAGAPTWGTIIGTLSSQTDLQNALDIKLEGTDLIGYALESWVTANFQPIGTYDNYVGWSLYVDDLSRGTISTSEIVNVKAGTNVTLGYSATNNTITINSTSGTVDYINGSSFNTSTGVLTLTGVGSAGTSVNLDNRYLLPSEEKYVNGASFNTSTGVLTLTGVNGAGASIDLDGRWDNYGSWSFYANGSFIDAISSGESFNVTGSGGITITGSSTGVNIDGSGISSSATWGSITGTLTDQSDLALALDNVDYAAWGVARNGLFFAGIYSGYNLNFIEGTGITLGSTGGASPSLTIGVTGYLPLTGGTLTGALNGTSSVFSSTVTATNFILSSDINLKENINDISIDDIDNIHIKSFNYINDETKRKRYGVIAQDLQKVAPEMVYTDNDGVLKVAYIDLLVAKVARLEERIKLLENNG